MEKESNKEIAIKTLKQQAQSLLDQIKSLQVDYDAIKRAYEFLLQRGNQTSFLSTSVGVKTGEFKNMTIQNAILKILSDHPEKEFRANEMTKLLEQGGIKTTSKRFLNIVTTTVLHLAKKGLIKRIKIDGVRGSKYKTKAEG